MQQKITHKTAYTYSEPASLSQNELFLEPRTTRTQNVHASSLQILPKPQYYQKRTDYFGNNAHTFMIQQPHGDLSILSTSIIETSLPSYPPAEKSMPWETVVQCISEHKTPEDRDAYQFVFESPLIATTLPVKDFACVSFSSGKPVLACALDLIGRIFHEFTYDKTETQVDTPVHKVLENRKGVCQDFAHLAISALRSMGLAARYVSGYLETQPPPGKAKLVGADASHAWLSLYVPGLAWVDLGPTNNLIPGEKHITIAWGRDYGDVTPVKGVVMGGGSHTLTVTVDVAANASTQSQFSQEVKGRSQS